MAEDPANLSLIATNLGPTRPGVDPGQPFPASPRQIVNSPLEVTVNGGGGGSLHCRARGEDHGPVIAARQKKRSLTNMKMITLLLAPVIAGPIALAGSVTGKIQCKGMKDNRDAVVYLENVPGQVPAPKDAAVIDQLKMVFIPHVLPVLVGTSVKFLNSDSVLHNVFTPSKAGNRFNLGSWPKGQTKTYTFDKPGEVRLLCNVHPEMEAWVIVLTTPYFVKTGPDGSYSIANAPPGKYTLRVWHEKAKFAPIEVTVPASGDVTSNVAGQ
ncbi:MAG: hypothetical protein HY235_26175 [Acidobacteria bacterium]|nr:hypothetical protein [Acidobacteriota bacterium]